MREWLRRKWRWRRGTGGGEREEGEEEGGMEEEVEEWEEEGRGGGGRGGRRCSVMLSRSYLYAAFESHARLF